MSTQRCACTEICTWRFTKYCACHEICNCTSSFTKRSACHEICTSRFTKRCAPQNLHVEVHKLSAVPATKSAHRGSQSAAPVTKSARRGSQSAELLDDHDHVQSILRLPRKLHFQVQQLRSLAPDFEAPKHEASLAPATKSPHTAPQRERSR